MTGDESNGRVTLAVISTKLDAIAERLDTALDCISDHDKRLREVEGTTKVNLTKIQNISEDVDRLQNKDTAGTILTSLLALGSGVIAWFK